MEMKEPRKRSASNALRKLCLEDYIDFCNDPDRPRLNIVKLNCIVYMHGFTRMYNRRKAEIVSTLQAMELMQAARSTLQERISRSVALTDEELSQDLETIGWSERPAGSVRSVEPAGRALQEVGAAIASPVAAIYCSGEAVEVEKRAKRKRKEAETAFPLAAVAAAGDAAHFVSRDGT